MAYKDGQYEIPSSRSWKKYAKKSRIRKLRREVKKDLQFIPHNNRYHGYS